MKRLALLVLLLVAVIAACFAVRSGNDAAPPSRPVVASTPESAPAPAGAAPGVPAATDPLSLPPGPERAAMGDARVQQQLGLDVTRASGAHEQLREYDATELDLFAQVERVSGKDPPPSLRDLLRQRRDGATAAELRALVDREFGGDVVVRATVLRWLDRNVPAEPAPASPDRDTGAPKRSVVGPLSPK